MKPGANEVIRSETSIKIYISLVMDRPLTRENARKYWMGQLQQEIKDAESF